MDSKKTTEYRYTNRVCKRSERFRKKCPFWGGNHPPYNPISEECLWRGKLVCWEIERREGGKELIKRFVKR